MNRSELKENAKLSLKGKYIEVIKMNLLYFIISFAAGACLGFVCGIFNINNSIIELLSNLLTIFISGLFGFGQISFYLKISRNEEVTYKELFNKTELLLSFIIISLLIGLFTFLWSLLFIIPGIIASISYSFAYYIALDNPSLSPREVIKKSKEMLKGHKMDLFLLTLSFVGWIILSLFTFGLLYIWLIPYMNVTICNFYNKIKEL